MMSSCKFKISPTNQRHSKVITMNVMWPCFSTKLSKGLIKKKTLYLFFSELLSARYDGQRSTLRSLMTWSTVYSGHFVFWRGFLIPRRSIHFRRYGDKWFHFYVPNCTLVDSEIQHCRSVVRGRRPRSEWQKTQHRANIHVKYQGKLSSMRIVLVEKNRKQRN